MGTGNMQHAALLTHIPATEIKSPALARGTFPGEVSLWGEEINEHNLIYKAWPRSAAFGERMWSPRSQTDPYEAAPRLTRHYCRMTFRGIPASPISPGSCYHH